MVAWSDFSQKMKDDLSPPDVSEPFTAYISKLENYDVRITTDDKTNTVRFSPKVTEEWRIFGGAATYTVRKSDFVVIDKTYEK